MRYIRDEIPSHGFESADAGQILHKKEAAAFMCIRDNKELQKLFTGRQFDSFALHFTGLLTMPPDFDQLMIANHLRNTVHERVVYIEEPLRRGVGKLHLTICIRDQNTICELVKHGCKTRVLRI